MKSKFQTSKLNIRNLGFVIDLNPLEVTVAHRIEIGLKKEIRDPLGERVRRRIPNDLGLSVKSVKTISLKGG
jgi:hypothetical protein